MNKPVFMQDFYWLHLRPDGIIEKVPAQPKQGVRFRVSLLTDQEECKTEDRVTWERFIEYFSVMPPGQGWRKHRRLFEDEVGWVTYWRRPRR